MPAWWDSFEVVTAVTWYLKIIAWGLGGLAVIVGGAALITNKRAETLSAMRQSERILLDIQRQQILDLLAGHPTGSVQVVCPRRSPEPRKYALALTAVLTEAGWQPTLNDRAVFPQPPSNLEIRVHSDGPKLVVTRGDLPDRAVTLYDALKLAGLPVAIRFEESIPGDEVQLVVGLNP